MGFWLMLKQQSLGWVPHTLFGLAALLCTEAMIPATVQAQTMGGSTAMPVSAPLDQPTSPAPVAPAQATAPLPQQSEGAYTLGAGDVINMDLFRLPQYSGEFEVQVDGSLSLPLVGNVNIQGLTLDQATSTLTQRYTQYLRRPGVTLNLVRRRPLVVGIAGEVNRPGAYPLRIEGSSFPKLSQLFEAAGGITQSANLRQIQIQRQVNGSTQTITANLWDLINTGNLNQDITLRDGDSIFVPSTLVPLDEAPILAAATFSSDVSVPINIAIIGEVFRPGPYTLRGGPTRTGDAGVPGGEAGSTNRFSPVKVTDAIQIAGGIKPKANIRQVQVRRVTRSGREEVFSVDLWNLLQTGEVRQNAILQEGDTVFIPTATGETLPAEAAQLAQASFSPNTIRVNVVGEVRRAGLVEIPPNSTLNQGILAAGGFNTRAQQDVVGLIRLNPDGTVTQREIPIDFAQGIDEANNPTLQNNDVIIVGETGLARFSDNVGNLANPIGSILSIFTAPFRLLNLFN